MNRPILSLVIDGLEETIRIVKGATENITQLNIHGVVQAKNAKAAVRFSADKYSLIALRYDLCLHEMRGATPTKIRMLNLKDIAQELSWQHSGLS